MTSLRRRIRFVWTFSARFSFVLLLPVAAAHAQQKPAPSQDPLVRMNESIDALTRKVWPSVVQILVSSYGPRENNDRGEANVVIGTQQSTGSGFVIDAGRLHHDERPRRERRAPHSDHHAGRQRRRHARNRVVGADLPDAGPHRGPGDGTGSRALESRRTEAAGAAPRHLLASPARGDGLRIRESDWNAKQPDPRPGVRRGAAD